ncbi:MAG TPA: hypothetical protein VGB61_08025, partial [Pyrinomonadaceae bacterium]
MILDQREYYRASTRIDQLRRVGFFRAGAALSRFRGCVAGLRPGGRVALPGVPGVAAGLTAAGARLSEIRARYARASRLM